MALPYLRRIITFLPHAHFSRQEPMGESVLKPKVIQQAEVLESDPITAKIVFHDPIPRGEYNLVVSSRCGDGRDYTLRRIGHPVTVP